MTPGARDIVDGAVCFGGPVTCGWLVGRDGRLWPVAFVAITLAALRLAALIFAHAGPAPPRQRILDHQISASFPSGDGTGVYLDADGSTVYFDEGTVAAGLWADHDGVRAFAGRDGSIFALGTTRSGSSAMLTVSER